MKFNDIIGHTDVKNKLKSFVDNDKIPHAILLWGDSGSGKLSIARAFAQYVHCSNKNDDSCGNCPNCIQHESFNQADTFFVFPVIKKSSPTKNISDDYIENWKKFLKDNEFESFERWLKFLENENSQPRIYVTESESIIHKMSMTSFTSKYKVMIIWLPEKMNEDCANKLLKIIEEPYPDSIFVLVSDNPKEILPTIYSRTQRIEVKRLSINEISSILEKKYGVDHDKAYFAASACDGDVTLAEEYLNDVGENNEFFDSFVRLMRMAYIRDIKGLKKWSEEVNDYKREKERRFVKYCSRMLRENFIYNINFENHILNCLSEKESNFSTKFAPFINERNVEDMIQQFDLADKDIAGNSNGKIVFFDLALIITKLIKK